MKKIVSKNFDGEKVIINANEIAYCMGNEKTTYIQFLNSGGAMTVKEGIETIEKKLDSILQER
jgi:hypothetical protein